MIPEWSWQWHPHPDVWALVALLGGGYLYALRRVAARALPPGTQAATGRQKVLFGLGLAALLVAADWPVHDLAEGSLYSVHMVQHMLLSLVMPPLLLLGTPAWLFRRIVRPRIVLRVVRTLSRPFYALLVFNVVLVFTHWPALVSLAVGNEAIHFGTHAVLVSAALLMWMPVASPVLEVPRLSYPGQMVYLFLQSLVPTVPASFLTFGHAPLYRVYEDLPRVGGISALTDQRVAGLIMKIVGGFILWGVITALWFKWFAAERGDGVDMLKWHDVDRDLNRMEMTNP